MKDKRLSGGSMLLPVPIAVLLSLTYVGCGADELPGESEPAGEVAQAVVSHTECATIVRPGAAGTVYDTQVKDVPLASSTKNYGASWTMNTGPLTGARRQSLLQFDLHTIPSGSSTNIHSAAVTLSEGALAPSAASTVDVHRITASWDESTVTWGMFQENYDPAVVTSFSNYASGSPDPTPGFDITSLVQGWVGGAQHNFGVLLDDPSGASTNYWTSESVPVSTRPALDVCFDVTCAPGYDDCNNNGFDGCETRLATSAAHCGACGNACPTGTVCRDGACNATCPVLLGPASSYAVHTYPRSVAVADLDGDGNADLVVPNLISNDVSVLRNLGDGTFAPRVDYPTSAGPAAVAVGDVTGDGKPDIVVGNLNGNSQGTVLVNQGDGTFVPGATFSPVSIVTSVALSDLNGDGKLDIVVARYSAGGIGVLFNQGNGTFAAQVAYQATTGAQAVAIGDLDGDGRPDIAVSDPPNSSVDLFYNQGNGIFSTAPLSVPAGTNAFTVAMADLDGDGKLDLAVAGADATVGVMLNGGNQSWSSPVTYPDPANPGNLTSSVTGPILAVADLNDDGLPDLAVSDSIKVNVLVNQSSGTFAPPVPYSAGPQPIAVATGDLNGDGKLDLAVVSKNNNTAGVLLNQSVCPTPPPTCTDGIKNGTETAIDCGGGTCPPCAAGQGCTLGSDCAAGVCTGGACNAPSCSDGHQNGNETAIDCGGGACPPCATGQACTLASDCAGNVCTANTCVAATCSDGVKNGSETAVDCGGGACPACATGKLCLVDSDCVSGDTCQSYACAPPPCSAAHYAATQSVGTVQSSGAFNYGPSSAFSIGMWASISTAHQLLMTKGDNNTKEWGLLYHAAMQKLCFVRINVANIACGPVPTGGWHHYAATYNNGTASVYADGVLVATGSGPIGTANTPLSVGNNSLSFNANFAPVVGDLNDAAVWSKVLTLAEVQGLYHGTTTPSQIGNLEAEWPLNEGAGTLVADSSGNGHGMTMNSVTWSNTCFTPAPAAVCGNGVVDPGEQCDRGSKNSNNVLSACTTSCMSTGLVALFDASDVNGDGTSVANGANVATWVDLVNGHDATQVTVSQQPIYTSSAINGQPGLQFSSGSNTVMTAPVDIDSTVLPNATVIAVFQNTAGGTSAYVGVWGQDDGGYDRFLVSGGNGAQGTGISSGSNITPVPGIAAQGAPLISVASLRDGGGAGTSSVYINGTSAASFAESHNNAGTHTMSIGNINGPPAASFGAFHGYISLIAVFDHALTAAEVQALEAQIGPTYVPSTTPIINYLGGSATHRNDGPYTVGSLFQVGGSNITITALGAQDDGASGPSTDGFPGGNVQVGLWNASGTTLLATATVLSSDPLTGTYRYQTLSTPVTLLANTQYLIGALVAGTHEWFEDTFSNTPVFSGQAGITIVAPRYNSGGSLTAPMNVSAGPAARYAPANALFY